jgi:2-aminoadipate transaminase
LRDRETSTRRLHTPSQQYWPLFFRGVTFADSRVDAQALFEIALAEGVAHIPGPAFSTDDHFHDALRPCFTTSMLEHIDEGVARLKRAVIVSRVDL